MRCWDVLDSIGRMLMEQENTVLCTCERADVVIDACAGLCMYVCVLTRSRRARVS